MTGVMQPEVIVRTRGARIVELVGPAGCGKSSLAFALTAANKGTCSGPNLWGLPRPALVRAAVGLTPIFFHTTLTSRAFNPELFGQMIRMDALGNLLSNGLRETGEVLIVDEGPVFALAWMEVFFPRWNNGHSAPWRARAIAEWAVRLDAIVRMDADDVVLAHRIRTRAKEHPVKNLSFGEIRSFTASYRDAFDRVIAELQAAGPVEVIDIRTDGEPGRGVADARVALGKLFDA